MGELAEVFTNEERLILGEIDELPPAGDQVQPPAEGEQPPEGEVKTEGEVKEPKVKEPEHTPEEKAEAEKMGFRLETDDKGKSFIIDDEGTKIPLKRWKSLYWEGQETQRAKTETERKFNLFKELGPDKFYSLYPDEAPQGWKPTPAPVAAPELTADTYHAIGSMQVEGGPYDGMTLNEVYQRDPAYAITLQQTYLNEQNQKVNQIKDAQSKLRQESETEVNQFSEQLAQERFGKETAKLSEQELRVINSEIKSTLSFLAERGLSYLSDAYFLMNKDKLINEAKTKAGKSVLENLSKGTIASISGGGVASATGWAAYETMTADQLGRELEAMDEKKAQEFLKNAPQSMKQKYPGLPWD